uniref:Uncharacterized protein n=1 Tax=Anguilla anguilla TaxID=7936 RepID=A0A0E9RL39_ANGAN
MLISVSIVNREMNAPKLARSCHSSTLCFATKLLSYVVISI